MEYPPFEHLNVNSPAREYEDYLERFEIWCTTCKEMPSEKQVAHFLTVIGKDAYALLKNLAFPRPPKHSPYMELKRILLAHVKPVNFEAAERAKFH